VGYRPRLLVTGFGPFPNAPENPTQTLMASLAAEPPEKFGAAALRAIVLATDYRKSWLVLRRAYVALAPDVVVHFGLSRNADALAVERVGRRRVDASRPDAAGFAPPSGMCRRSGPDELAATLPVDATVKALVEQGFPAAASDDAGGYVCNATLYRSLLAVNPGDRRLVGFIHVPPEGRNGWTGARLKQAAELILRIATAAAARA
jgi:pyroglutamyl-peptidase